MSRLRRPIVLVAAFGLSAGAATVLAARDGTRTTTAPAPATATTARVPVAPAGPQPRLRAGWRRVRDRHAGFTVGLPPGWTSRRNDGTLVISSRDRTLAIAVGADRSAAGRVASPRSYASEAIGTLRGYRGLRASPARPLPNAPYPAARATASGTYAPTGVAQEITLVALHRRGEGTYTLLAFRSAQTPPGPARRIVDQVVETVHAERPA